MSSIPSSGICLPMNTTLPPPIPPSIPLLPLTSTSPSVPPAPSHSSPLPPISTISNPDGDNNPLKASSNNQVERDETVSLMKPTVIESSLLLGSSPRVDNDSSGHAEGQEK